ncbi:MAG: hypothetical protein ACO2OS_00765 [Thermosphaera aggregans]|jgi:predicted amino acid-binding ACT domain protein|uniref:hypothetical protein n=1 Tax=Thermosphaera aggregans TaxID=54254 RepID=UPI003C0A4749
MGITLKFWFQLLPESLVETISSYIWSLKTSPGLVAKVTDIVKESGLNISNITTLAIVKGDLFVMVENCDRKCGETLSKNVKKGLGKLLSDINVYDSR